MDTSISVRAGVTMVLALAMPVHGIAQSESVDYYMAAIEAAQPADESAPLAGLTMTELMQQFNVPGISVAVIRDFEIHWAKGYGVADVVTSAPVDTGTLFQAASVSKPVAAMAVMRAVQDGLFSLDDDINNILESWQLDGEGFTADHPVTPRGLTSHTSGLGDGFGFPGYHPDLPRPSVVQILEGHELSNVQRIFMQRAPASFMEYSGGGTTLMQLALTDARDRPFQDIMQADVLGPLGMSNSTYEQPLPAQLEGNAARAHDQEGAAMDARWHVYPEQAAAGLWTTPTDLTRFVIDVQKSAIGESSRVLDRANVREMLTPVGVGDFAVGFQISQIGQGWYFRHSGSNWGFRSLIVGHLSKGYGLAVMTNANQGTLVANEVFRRIQRVYEWDSVAEPVPRGY